jgi:hypothetical protein
LEKLYKDYKDRAEFYIVYIREAHPSDGWAMPQNEKQGINVKQPKTYEERCKVASDCIKAMKLSIPALVDDMSDTAEKGYSGWPDRFFLVGKDGKLAYVGGQGPRGFKPDEIEEELKKLPKIEEKKDEKKSK